MHKVGYGLVASLVLAACGTAPVTPRAIAPSAMRALAAATGSFQSEAFGERSFKLYVPKSLAASQKAAPLVVMLHGCTQDPDQFAAGTRMNQLADREGFYVLYPDQPRLAHAFKCWRWFEPASQARGSGEPKAIVGMVEQVASKRAVDKGAIYAAGISAGGAMATILGATYPDVFAAIGVASGLEYKAATNEMEGRTAMSQGGPDPVRMGQAAHEASQGNAKVVPTIVFHGADDRIVAPVNEDQIVVMWAKANDLALGGGHLDATPDGREEGQAPNGKRYTRWFYKDDQGRTLLEKVAVTGMGHAWAGGDTAGSYTDPQGPDATGMTWAFFKANKRRAAGLKKG